MNDYVENKALDFIQEKKANPFFLYFSLTLPHPELVTTDKNIKGNWKMVRLMKKDRAAKIELSNLASDLVEAHDLSTKAPAHYQRMTQLLNAARTKSENPAFVTLEYRRANKPGLDYRTFLANFLSL